VQATALANERTAVDVLNRRLAASVLLIKALGGGWNASDLPTPDELARRDPYPRKDAGQPR
jgi:outer membrane protein TolC